MGHRCDPRRARGGQAIPAQPNLPHTSEHVSRVWGEAMDRGARAVGYVEDESGRSPRRGETGADKDVGGAGERVEGVGG